ncbi:hypothetical protein OAS19_00955 [Altererythrobacter sp.]|nr:hypothetical protein [Altererythrobacter sp.]
MYSQEEINSAVAAGALSRDAADALRAHVVNIRERPVTDEEHFRLVNSFNDIFVAIGVVIMLVAAGAIGQAIARGLFPAPAWPMSAAASEAEFSVIAAARSFSDKMQAMFAALLVAGAAWPLAEFFTRKRRMALPSIILLVAFVGAVMAALVSGSVAISGNIDERPRLFAGLLAVSGLLTVGAAYLHWQRFHVPITVAAGATALAVTAIALIGAVLGIALDPDIILVLVFLAGLAIFVFAMRWDMSDRIRETRRSDVAFWLHLAAAPMIAHPIFSLLGVTDGGSIGIGSAVGVLVVYVLFGLIALAVDRRALLVSALAYVLAALTFLFDRFGAVELNVALTALVIGSALLSLSAFWTPIRQRIVGVFPADLQAKLPAVALSAS